MGETDLLGIIIVVLLAILWTVVSISRRLKERFPAEKESDLQWGKDDPVGHFEAHEAAKKSKK
jgi:hypothetical protein